MGRVSRAVLVMVALARTSAVAGAGKRAFASSAAHLVTSPGQVAGSLDAGKILAGYCGGGGLDHLVGLGDFAAMRAVAAECEDGSILALEALIGSGLGHHDGPIRAQAAAHVGDMAVALAEAEPQLARRAVLALEGALGRDEETGVAAARALNATAFALRQSPELAGLCVSSLVESGLGQQSVGVALLAVDALEVIAASFSSDRAELASESISGLRLKGLAHEDPFVRGQALRSIAGVAYRVLGSDVAVARQCLSVVSQVALGLLLRGRGLSREAVYEVGGLAQLAAQLEQPGLAEECVDTLKRAALVLPFDDACGAAINKLGELAAGGDGHLSERSVAALSEALDALPPQNGAGVVQVFGEVAIDVAGTQREDVALKCVEIMCSQAMTSERAVLSGQAVDVLEMVAMASRSSFRVAASSVKGLVQRVPEVQRHVAPKIHRALARIANVSCAGGKLALAETCILGFGQLQHADEYVHAGAILSLAGAVAGASGQPSIARLGVEVLAVLAAQAENGWRVALSLGSLAVDAPPYLAERCVSALEALLLGGTGTVIYQAVESLGDVAAAVRDRHPALAARCVSCLVAGAKAARAASARPHAVQALGRMALRTEVMRSDLAVRCVDALVALADAREVLARCVAREALTTAAIGLSGGRRDLAVRCVAGLAASAEDAAPPALRDIAVSTAGASPELAAHCVTALESLALALGGGVDARKDIVGDPALQCTPAKRPHAALADARNAISALQALATANVESTRELQVAVRCVASLAKAALLEHDAGFAVEAIEELASAAKRRRLGRADALDCELPSEGP